MSTRLPDSSGRRRPRRRWQVTVLVLVTAATSAACASSTQDAAVTTTPIAPRATDAPSTAPRPTAAGPSAGCKGVPAVAPGDEEIHLTADGADRWYRRHVPSSYDPTKPMPLVIDIHGYAEGAALHAQISGLAPYGDQHGFLTITPNGQGTPVHWNANLGSPDVALIGTILDQAEAQLCIDRSRVYVTGYSNGAFMTSAVACQYSDRIAAVAPVAGMRDVPGCNFTRPVPALAFHGTADHFVEFNGGMGSGAATLPAPDGSGRTLGELGPASAATGAIVPGSMDQKMPDITAAWAKRNGCQTVPSEEKVADDVTLVTFPCPAGQEVKLYRVNEGGHAWPGSAGSVAIGSVVGPTTMNINATQLMWDFFAAHPRT